MIKPSVRIYECNKCSPPGGEHRCILSTIGKVPVNSDSQDKVCPVRGNKTPDWKIVHDSSKED